MYRRIALLTAVWLIGGAALAQDRSGMAVTALNHVNMARQAVDAHDQKAALDHVGQALTTSRQILLESAAQPQPVVVTLSKDIETVTTYRPVKHRGGGEMTADRMKHDTSVREVQGVGSVEQWNVTAAADQLAQAKSALERQDFAAADSILSGIQNGVIRTRVDGDMPLLEAKQNLQMARARILESKPGDAKAPLRAAAQALADFQRLAPGPDAEKANYMRQQMLDRAERIRHDHSDSVDWIDSWLATIDKWERKTTVHR